MKKLIFINFVFLFFAQEIFSLPPEKRNKIFQRRKIQKQSKETYDSSPRQGLLKHFKEKRAQRQNTSSEKQGLFSKLKETKKSTSKKSASLLENPFETPPTHRKTVDNPPFKHVMIFSGGDLDFFTFFGMYDAAIAAGNPPDLIIGTCGGGLATTIIKAFPNSEDRKNFLKSETFYEYMKATKYTDMSLLAVIKDLKKVAHQAALQLHPDSEARVVPNPFYQRTLMDPRNNYEFDELDQILDSRKGPEIVILSNEINYSPNDVGKTVSVHDKLYTETIYASERVKKMIQGIKSFTGLGKNFPNSFVATKPQIITGANLNEAARNSFSDPYYLPVDKPFLTGAANVNTAYEIAQLGEELTSRYAPQWERVGGGIMTKFFAINPWNDYENYASRYADRWVDNTSEDYEKISRKVTWAPTLKSLPSAGVRVKSKVPQYSHTRFIEIMKSQYQYAYNGYMQANKLPKNYKGHISKRYDRALPTSQLLEARENSGNLGEFVGK